ncbi:phenylacetaldoxime dehydratase family protein [Embleya sp. NBC_00888]|uniref:phenylacetaldoxime dehydratase family protein n=1 Tax=Embleya sp. NBC_00888 TaxID=2975960 RepID=UPI0038633352|nr:phenylacetaldoxime dehydratase family protein [Embleya sp. NBC_00888]
MDGNAGPPPLFHVSYPRRIPARAPENHVPAAPRFSLRWRHAVPTLVSDYFGLQGAGQADAKGHEFVSRMSQWFSEPNGPSAYEITTCIDETGRPATVVLAYWTSPSAHAAWSTGSSWRVWWEDAARPTEDVGYWREHLMCPYDRHETIYSDPNYRVGLARTPNSELVPITTNGYFGAARDRIPLSAVDDLQAPVRPSTPPARRTAGARLAVTIPHNLTVLRSGQFWHNSDPEQAADYEQNLRVKLDRGMDYLEQTPDSGCLYLRRLTNMSEDGTPRRETSIQAVFTSLADLESWAAVHETHLAIYRHAIAMKRRYGEHRDVVTWHELFVLPGGTLFEYLNCAENTGMLPYLPHLGRSPEFPLPHVGNTGSRPS